MVLQILLFTFLQESELIHIFLDIEKSFHNVITLIKPVVNKNENNYYYFQKKFHIKINPIQNILK